LRIVFLPGLLCDGGVFTAQTAALARRVGISIADFTEAKTIEDMARAALDAFEGPVALVGFSMGGRAAIEAARLAPGRVARVCLASQRRPTPKGGSGARRSILSVAKASAPSARDWVAAAVHPGRRADPSLIEPLKAMTECANAAQLARHSDALLARPDAYPTLSHIACPALVIAGRQDPWVPVGI